MYSYTRMVGYSDCSPSEELKIPALINYIQDCSMFHSASIGFDLKHYRDIKKAWLLSSWQIEIEELPVYNDTVKICTIPYEYKNFYGMRNFWLENEAGKKLVLVNSIWFFMDLEKESPVKVIPEEMEGYGCEERLDMAYEERRIRIPKEAAFDKVGEPVIVTEAFLDTNNHVNNAHYIRIAYEILQQYGTDYAVAGICMENAGFYPRVKQIRAEYVKSAKYGDMMQAHIYKNENLIYVKLTDKDDKDFAIVSFKCE